MGNSAGLRMKKIKIFIVEDNPADLGLIKDLCQGLNKSCAFIEARDGQFAIEEIDKFDRSDKHSFPDFIILDLNLPRKDGHEVLGYLKNDELFKMIPVVIFSSSSSPQDVHAALKGNANSFVIKPFLLEDFENAIAKMYNYWVDIALSPFQ
jgi:chemotaxis family two-component system response regulator Rcp1